MTAAGCREGSGFPDTGGRSAAPCYARCVDGVSVSDRSGRDLESRMAERQAQDAQCRLAIVDYAMASCLAKRILYHANRAVQCATAAFSNAAVSGGGRRLEVVQKGLVGVSELRRLLFGLRRQVDVVTSPIRARVCGGVPPSEPRMQHSSVRRGFLDPL